MWVPIKGIPAVAAVCFRESHSPLLSNFFDSPDTWSTGWRGEKLSHGDRELHLADLLPLPLLYENGLSEQLVRQKCLPVSQCGWYCDPPPVHAEPGSKQGGGRGQFYLLPNPLSSCLFCLSVWADFSLLFFLLHLQHFNFCFQAAFFFLHSIFSWRGGTEGDTHTLIEWVYFYLILFGCRRCLPRGSLQLLSWAGGRRGWLLSEVLSAQRLIGNSMRDSAQKRHSLDGQISWSHLGTSRRVRNTSCRGASHSLACYIISSHLAPTVYTLSAALYAWSAPREGQAELDQRPLEPLSLFPLLEHP